MDRVDQRTAVATGNDIFYYCNNGAGARAYVVDTGVSASHNDLSGSGGVLAGVDFVNPNGNTTIPQISGTASNPCTNGTRDWFNGGHGTFIAGMISGDIAGIAKGTTIVPVRVFDCGGNGTSAVALSGLNWIRDNHPNNSGGVVNLSFGYATSDPNANAIRDAINTLIDPNRANKVTVVASANNDNQDACGKTPAREGGAITVGATTEDDRRSSFSNWGTCVDIFAPGEQLVGPTQAGCTAGQPCSNTAIGQGTSFAAPLVAGAAARWLGQFPTWNSTQVWAQLQSGGTVGALANPPDNTGLRGSPNLLLFMGGSSRCRP